jgi:hypothetical protein
VRNKPMNPHNTSWLITPLTLKKNIIGGRKF